MCVCVRTVVRKGDVKVQFFKDKDASATLLYFCFHSAFLGHNRLELPKAEVSKALKDEACKRFAQHFRVICDFCPCAVNGAVGVSPEHSQPSKPPRVAADPRVAASGPCLPAQQTAAKLPSAGPPSTPPRSTLIAGAHRTTIGTAGAENSRLAELAEFEAAAAELQQALRTTRAGTAQHTEMVGMLRALQREVFELQAQQYKLQQNVIPHPSAAYGASLASRQFGTVTRARQTAREFE